MVTGHLLPDLSYVLVLRHREPDAKPPDPSLMKPILPSVFKGAVVSVAILAALFFLTYLPQVAVLAFVSGPLGASRAKALM